MLVSMIPRSASIGLRRIPQYSSSRKFSSVLPSGSPRLSQFLVRTPQRITTTLTSLRFNSTSTTPPSEPPNFLPDYIPTTQSLSGPAPITEHIGFLKEYGLDYGYGFTTLVQSLLEHIHIYTETPWYGSIILTVGVIRLLQFPFYLKMSDTAAKMKELNPFAVPITKKMRDAQLANDRMGMMTARAELSQLYTRAGVKRRWLFFPITQIPIFYGFYKTLRGMSDIPIPTLTEGGLGWFTDMTVSDPFYLLPLVTSTTLLMQLSLGGEAGTNLQTEKMRKVLLITLPLITFTFTSQWPAILTFYFLCNSSISLIQTLVLKNAWIREKFGLYPLAEKALPNPLPSLPIKIVPTSTTATTTASSEVKQIGGKGSWMDRITGGQKEAEKQADDSGFMGGIFKGKGDQAAHKAYEEKRQARLAKEQAAERERRSRRKRMQDQDQEKIE